MKTLEAITWGILLFIVLYIGGHFFLALPRLLEHMR